MGWMLAATENGELAADFIRQCHEAQGIEPGYVLSIDSTALGLVAAGIFGLAGLSGAGRAYNAGRVDRLDGLRQQQQQRVDAILRRVEAKAKSG